MSSLEHNYILENDGTLRAARDILEWANWFETAKRHIGNTVVGSPGEQRVRVSTVFLGLDHNWGPGGSPLVFETMVFDGEFSNRDLECERYSTLDEAMQGHDAMVAECVTKYGEPAREDTRFGFHPAVLARRAKKP